MIRRLLVLAHRYAGLAIALFLALEGITGTLLAYNTALEHLINPQLFAAPKPGARRMSLGALAARAEALVPAGRTDYLFDNGDQIMVRMEARSDAKGHSGRAIGFDQLFLDPWTGRELGRRLYGDLAQGRINAMPFVYNLHFELAYGAPGTTLLGIVAVFWTIDSFVALYLTFPRVRRKFWHRWSLAWKVKHDAGPFRLNFDLHRASGLWCWSLVLVFAVSSVMLTLPSLYDKAVAAVLPYRTIEAAIASATAHPIASRKLDWLQAEAVGRRLLAQEASRHGISLGRPDSMAYIADFGVYDYSASSSRDVRADRSDTGVWLDAHTGALREFFLPTGQDAGNTLSTWLWGLHYGDIYGSRLYRAIVACFGLVVATLSITGIYVWWKKRTARRSSRRMARDPVV